MQTWILSPAIFVTPDLDLSDVRDHLSSIPGLGDVSVSYTGSCSAFDYTVTLTTLAGNQNQLMVNLSNCRIAWNILITSVLKCFLYLKYHPLQWFLQNTNIEYSNYFLTVLNILETFYIYFLNFKYIILITICKYWIY